MPKARELTPFERLLRNVRFARQMGHEPLAANCVWGPDGGERDGRSVCLRCRELDMYMGWS